MKHIILILSLIHCFTEVYSQNDIWVPVVENGFGVPPQKTVPEMEIFKDTLYVSTAPYGAPANALLWRTGDGVNWEDVTPDSILSEGDNSIHSFGKTDLGGGFFYLGTGHAVNGARIYSSQNGKDWTPISPAGFNTSQNSGAAPNMQVFNGYLYAGAGSHGNGGAAEVWRIPYNSTDSTLWEKIVDFDTVATIVDTVDLISYFEVWNGKIYFSTNGKGQLWESSDGINFTQNTGVGYGFSDPDNIVISAIEIFQDTMYITTTNFNDGGQLYRSGDGISWEPVTTDAFGQGSAVNELRKPVIGGGKLWITGYTVTSLSSGTPIWRSQNGIDWIQSNVNGFGDTLNNGQNPSLVAYGNYMYFGGPNYTAGGQIWRTDVYAGNDNQEDIQAITIYPNPINSGESFNVSFESLEPISVKIYNMSGKIMDSKVFVQNSQINTSKWLPGVYICSIQTESGITSIKKIIIL